MLIIPRWENIFKSAQQLTAAVFNRIRPGRELFPGMFFVANLCFTEQKNVPKIVGIRSIQKYISHHTGKMLFNNCLCQRYHSLTVLIKWGWLGGLLKKLPPPPPQGSSFLRKFLFCGIPDDWCSVVKKWVLFSFLVLKTKWLENKTLIL